MDYESPSSMYKKLSEIENTEINKYTQKKIKGINLIKKNH